MGFLELDVTFETVCKAPPIWRATVTQSEWEKAARVAKESGVRLLCIWGAERRRRDGMFAVYAAYVLREGLVILALPLEGEALAYPNLAWAFPYADRMQRAVYDLVGLRAAGLNDERGWLNHGAWPKHYFPLRTEGNGQEVLGDCAEEDYAFVRVEGEGVHEIPVGPVHAGIIEPGHFRFSVVGEKVLRLEQRLGYTHKGIEKRFQSVARQDGYRLAGRVSGDSTVAYAWAYCMALECIEDADIPVRASWLRALMLERERVANHLGDLGALGNDAALAFGLAQFSRLKEDWLRTNHVTFGHRFMMDRVLPGGVAADITQSMRESITVQCEVLRKEVRTLRTIYDEHAGLQDRFMTTGHVSPELAVQLGLCGLAGRASGQAFDVRTEFRVSPYDEIEAQCVTSRGGDVAARVSVRFDELFESLRLIQSLCERLPPGPVLAPLQGDGRNGFGAGWIEGWRGPVFIALETDAAGAIARCHCHDPSWQNWPVLEHAVMGNIVPDFPLINKSFNLSYSGHDL